MEVFAKGKNIPTYPFGNLFIQGEKLADTITVSIERYYNGHDLNEYNFMIVGLTENDSEINQVLVSRTADNHYIRLKWNVSGDFTVNSGKLRLELRVFKETDEEVTTMIKYDMPSVYVKPTIKGKNEILPDTQEQFISNITLFTAECMEELQNYTTTTETNLQNSVESFKTEIQQKLDDFNAWVQDELNSFDIDGTKQRLDDMEADTAIYLARPEVIPVTRSQYITIQHKKNALYVITEED